MENLNILNCKKAGSEDAIAFIFKETNKNIINIIQKKQPSSIIRIGGSDYDAFVNGFNTNIYELNGYFDKEKNKEDEKKNFEKIKIKYNQSLQDADLILICTFSLIKNFGFIPNEKMDEFSDNERKYLIKYLKPKVPICHWDFVNFDYENNFFLNVFPYLENEKVCIVSSFTNDIKKQLQHKDDLFKNQCQNNRVGFVYKDFKYPTFKKIEYVQVPICYCEYEKRFLFDSPFENSLELLEDLKEKIRNKDANIFLIGAGLYSNPLCMFIKEQGKIGINCGSSIQLFFGLKGNRFGYLDEQEVTNKYWKYPNLDDCVMYTVKDNMGGFAMDGINAYTKL